jgi:hypothetical protein
MQGVNRNYQTALQNPSKSPVYLVLFDGITRRFSTNPVKNFLAETKQWVDSPSGGSSQITLNEGATSISNFQFKILDKSREVTKLISRYNMANRKVTVKAGFLELNETDYINIFTGKILNYTLDSTNLYWNFELVDFLHDEKSSLMTANTYLNFDLGIGDTTAIVTLTSAFAPSTSGKNYLKIDDEIIGYAGVTGTSFTGLFRGALGSTPSTHTNQSPVKNFIVLEGNAVDLLLQMILSTGAGTNGPYDVLPASQGLAIDQTKVDVPTFERARALSLSSYKFKFYFDDVIKDAKSFFESEILRFVNSYCFTNNNGQITLRVYSAPIFPPAPPILSDDNMIGPPTWQGNLFDKYFFNEIDLKLDYKHLTGNFDNRLFYEESTSQVKYSQVKTMTVESRGMRSDVMGQAKIGLWAKRVFKRFSNPTPIIGTTTFFDKLLLENSDIVMFNTNKLPDVKRGILGVSNYLAEIIEKAVNFGQGTISYKILDTLFSYNKKYALITPRKPAFPDFTGASTAQKARYSFISRKINPTYGVMSDGSDGYYWSP